MGVSETPSKRNLSATKFLLL